MTTVVIMPGGFHPFHPGHLSLYNSARRTFPDADVYVAATNDTSTRPFPFPIKEKLAYLAGTSKEDAIEPGHFIQVKSPFRADEITSQFDPNKDQLIFVRSVKDANKPPQAGGVLKTGKPAYLQPLLTAKKLEPFSKHAYMAYLPVEPFGGDKDMEGATQIRELWPTLDAESKLDFVNSLYPRTTNNRKLAATVAKMLDTAIGTSVDESHTVGYIQEKEKSVKPTIDVDPELRQAKLYAKQHYNQFASDPDVAFDKWVQRGLKHSQENDVKHDKLINFLTDKIIRLERELDQNTQTPQPTNEDYVEEKWSKKYKRSIDCSHPRGFSQRAHCAGRKK